MTLTSEQEIQKGARFAFGKNWRAYLKYITEERISKATQWFCRLLERETLEGLTFLDVGSGSGINSLVARRLGAKVRSFDYDPESVACTQDLREIHKPGDPDWLVEQGSILDKEYLAGLGQYDIVYSWGVLHHTGAMWEALENTASLVKPGGRLYVAIYNDMGDRSVRWRKIKKFYCSGLFGRAMVLLFAVPYFGLTCLFEDFLSLRNPLLRYKGTRRGMSIVFDCFDWIGGYPYEVSKPEGVFLFCRDRGFELENLSTVGATFYNNEYVFRKKP